MSDSNKRNEMLDEESRRKFIKAFGSMGIAGLAGCGGGGDGGGGNEGGDQQNATPTTIPATPTPSGDVGTVINYRDRDEATKAYAKAYNDTHDEFHINATIKATSTKYRKLIAQITAGNAPDVVGLDVIYIPRFYRLGILLNLGDFYKSLGYTDDIFQPLRQDFIRWNNEIVALPFWIDCSAYLYNTKHFKEAGLDPKNPPKTFQEFLDASRKLKSAGHTALSNTFGLLGLELFFFMPHVWAGGGALFNEKMTKSLIDQQPAVDALKFFKTLQDEGLATDQTASQWTQQAYVNREASMAFYSSGIGAIKDADKELYKNTRVAMFPKPKGGTRSSFIGGNSIIIPTQTAQKQKKLEGAKSFARWVNTKEGMRVTVEELGFLPARKAGFQTDFVQNRMEKYGAFKRALTQGHAPPMHPKILQMQEPLQNAIIRTLNGQMEAKPALSEAARKINRLL